MHIDAYLVRRVDDRVIETDGVTGVRIGRRAGNCHATFANGTSPSLIQIPNTTTRPSNHGTKREERPERRIPGSFFQSPQIMEAGHWYV